MGALRHVALPLAAAITIVGRTVAAEELQRSAPPVENHHYERTVDIQAAMGSTDYRGDDPGGGWLTFVGEDGPDSAIILP